MRTFDYYVPFYSKKAERFLPGVTPKRLTQEQWNTLLDSEYVRKLIEAYQNGDKNSKQRLPAICWTGQCYNMRRAAANMRPTQLYIIDVDHVDDPRAIWDTIKDEAACVGNCSELRLVHVTPSGKGLRIVAQCLKDFKTLIEHMTWLYNSLKLDRWAPMDTCVKDISRLSFCPTRSMVLYESPELWADADQFTFAPIPATEFAEKLKNATDTQQSAKRGATVEQPVETPQNGETLADFTYKGNRVADIAAKYVQMVGEPEQGERHNFYNELVKLFRSICDNRPEVLCAVLPRFGHTEEECLSQCRSITRTNTTSTLPKDFFKFLLDNGYWKPRVTQSDTEDLQKVDTKPDFAVNLTTSMPPLPPVFRELCSIAPPDFIIPAINALLPILGTLTCNLRAKYYYDGREHSTEFFSVVYAAPGAGKGFVERFIELLLQDLYLRDMLCDARENLYNRLSQKRSANDKGPDVPKVTHRIMEAKCSEAELLDKQSNNAGHHMFTYAAEMDQWAKGVRSAGGAKDDMLRIAFDNGRYGQQFKSTSTFKGSVQLYWNVLIAGTLDQLMRYFKNVENGLVSRCSFSEIENQEFAEPPHWLSLTKEQLAAVRSFCVRQDKAVYKQTLTFDPKELDMVDDKDFDKQVPWQYEWRPFVTVDMQWLKPTIDAFLEEQRQLCISEMNYARDSFRRRVAVRGFRLGLLCTALYTNMTSDVQKQIAAFVNWWMQCDLRGIMRLWSDKYNEAINDNQQTSCKSRNIFDELSAVFTKEDVLSRVKAVGMKTPIRMIIFRWNKAGLIKRDGDKYIKL